MGLANITASTDWLRFGMGGHGSSPVVATVARDLIIYVVQNIGTNAFLCFWGRIAKGTKSAANGLLRDVGAGLYRDNQTTTLHPPPDGSSWAMKANATHSDDQSRTISEALCPFWNLRWPSSRVQSHGIALPQ
ncbi:uncharacterized protein N7477_009025 [Penicillium maclennaniae]|uniref:uncharacterized protein n=1 Tax=Penicillium maclennaniae TaxID=1343394 RepID=UPI0025407DD6|nr:uncharacterized protein N7477_009025 [Penicillium maclennaniae]KAJ5661409.1 hypothetical protein N7477_009025 [Penicillium maclennaniae]